MTYYSGAKNRRLIAGISGRLPAVSISFWAGGADGGAFNLGEKSRRPVQMYLSDIFTRWQ